jgi:hypothetical protein
VPRFSGSRAAAAEGRSLSALTLRRALGFNAGASGEVYYFP